MSQWADKKRRKILIFLILFIVLALILFFTFSTKKQPTCFDGIQNGTETGIDCGGNCEKTCREEARNIIVWWERPFQVSKGIYNLVAYVENQNLQSGLERLDYEFRVYDKDNVLAAEPRRGSTFVEANKRFAIFEPSVTTGDNEAYTAFFKIIGQSDWKKVNPDFTYNLFQVSKPVLNKLETNPQLSANVKNASTYRFVDVPVVAIIYNHRGNAIATSQTYIDSIGSKEEQEVFFSWPEPFGKDIARVEIIPRVNPFLDLEKSPQSHI